MDKQELRILVDFSWLYSRSKFAYSELTHTVDGVVFATGSIHGCYDALVGMVETYKDARIVLCMDGTPKKQQRLAKSYKAGRDGYGTEGVIDVSKWDVAKAFLCIPNINICYHEWMEADETIAYLARTKAPNETIVVFSNDGDLRQLIDSKNYVFCSNEFKRGNGFEFEDEVHLFEHGIKDLAGLTPQSVALHLAICGDSSDGVIGIPRFLRAVSKAIANKALTLDNLKGWVNDGLHNVGDPKIAKGLLMIREYWKQVEVNWGLVNIDPLYIPEYQTSSNVTPEWFLNYNCVKAYHDVRSLIP